MSLSRANRILDYYKGQNIRSQLPKGVDVLNPFSDKEVIRVNRIFYETYYSDHKPRILILGINPGRFGAGITGIPFTDPIKLKESCGIEHNFPMKPELSSGYVYRLIEAFGGLKAFYSRIQTQQSKNETIYHFNKKELPPAGWLRSNSSIKSLVILSSISS